MWDFHLAVPSYLHLDLITAVMLCVHTGCLLYFAHAGVHSIRWPPLMGSCHVNFWCVVHAFQLLCIVCFVGTQQPSSPLNDWGVGNDWV